jgi:hypothetical protein
MGRPLVSTDAAGRTNRTARHNAMRTLIRDTNTAYRESVWFGGSRQPLKRRTIVA